MKVNYVLIYGTPYLKYRAFEKFDDISKYLIDKRIVNYTIYEQMEDLKEVEMIHLNNDIQVLEDRINKAIKHISNEFLCYDNESDEYIQGLKTIEILKGDSE